MNLRCAAAAIIFSASVFAQSPPPTCPAGRPVDEIIAEVHKQQSKKKNRNSNPFPEVGCIWGWCRDHSKTPPAGPEPAPETETPSGSSTGAGGTSSSKTTQNKCDDAMERALSAAHNVDVGDYYFEQKNYNGALLRYKDAAADKAQDIAIRVRMGRAFEKLNQVPQAIEQYQAALKLDSPQKWIDEAKAALDRLKNSPRP